MAVCLFGSLENYADFVIEAGGRRGGWTASTAEDIERFSSTGQFENGDICDSREDIAREAVQVCCRQGETGPGPDSRKGYNRNYTHGQTSDVAEWCAEIFLDVDLSAEELGPECGHSRVLVGAPLWARTPTLRSVYLYRITQKMNEEIDEKSRVSRGLSFGRLTKSVRWSGRSWMDRLLGRDRAQASFGDQPGRDHEEGTPTRAVSDDLDIPKWTKRLSLQRDEEVSRISLNVDQQEAQQPGSPYLLDTGDGHAVEDVIPTNINVVLIGLSSH